jgi:signal transduction histidine kinase
MKNSRESNRSRGSETRLLSDKTPTPKKSLRSQKRLSSNKALSPKKLVFPGRPPSSKKSASPGKALLSTKPSSSERVPSSKKSVSSEKALSSRKLPSSQIDRLVSLGELAAGVAHEIRNPLAGIGTSAQVLRSRFAKDDERVKFADVILDEVGRLEKIIENLLLFARPKQPQLVKHDMRHSVERAFNLLRDQIEKQDVRVQIRCDGEPPMVYVDPGQMSQVLLNLVLNAVHAMPSGGRLTLELKTVEKKMPVSGGRRKADAKPDVPARSFQFLRLVVSDSGQGIPRQNLSKLFTPFFTTKSAGTGLGLSISQAIMREHGGSISISSVEGRGTKVTVDIPVEKRYGERR